MAIHLSFQQDRCKGCELCVSVCPKHILALDPNAVNAKGYHAAACINETACIGCASCAKICPDSIITIKKD